MTRSTIDGSGSGLVGCHRPAAAGSACMRFENWSSRMFQVTFGNCLVNSSAEACWQVEAGLEVGQQLDRLGAAVRADSGSARCGRALCSDRRGDRRRQQGRGREGVPPRTPSASWMGHVILLMCFVNSGRAGSGQGQPSFGGAVVPRTTTSGVSSIEGGTSERRSISRRSRSAPTPSRLEQLLADGRESDVVGHLDVVVADDRQVVGDSDARVVRRGDDAQGLGVAGGEDGRRAIGRSAASVRPAPEPRSGCGRPAR